MYFKLPLYIAVHCNASLWILWKMCNFGKLTFWKMLSCHSSLQCTTVGSFWCRQFPAIILLQSGQSGQRDQGNLEWKTILKCWQWRWKWPPVWCMMYIWCMMYDVWCTYDVWCMMYDVWCMMYDVWCMIWYDLIWFDWYVYISVNKSLVFIRAWSYIRAFWQNRQYFARIFVILPVFLWFCAG